MKVKQQLGLPESNDRRNVLLGGAAVAATLATGTAFAATGADAHHHHHEANKNTGLIDTALHCIKTGDACQAHCIELVKQGDTSIADCLNTVAEMLPMCTALAKLASYNSTHLVALAKVCIDVCEACEKECRNHEDKHAECKACADSCAECIKECKKLVA